ncbi:MAG: hypothetical protein DRH23_09520 [Deltaproteobacteria bacterium]|nr:MAG: hypothetical protein DRH23_09520 [Deltaproteobacteria bacterium]
MKYAKPYLLFTVLVWLPWGLMCVFDITVIADIIGVSGMTPSGNSDLRAMYGGVQTAVGLIAALALYDTRFFPNLLFTLAFVGSCLALRRADGLFGDDRGTAYTWGVLAYEYFAAISSVVWLRILPRLPK